MARLCETPVPDPLFSPMARNHIFPSLVALILSSHLIFAGAAHHGRQFLGLTDFSEFIRGPGESPGEAAFLSPEFVTEIKWDQLIVSWNAELSREVALKIQARAIYPARSTQFYTMGIWSCSPDAHQRMSVKDQKDDDAEVRT